MAFALAQLFQLKFEAGAEISSLGANDRIYRLDLTPLEAHVTRKSKVSIKEENGTKVLNAFQTVADGDLKLDDSKQVGNKTQSGLENEPPMGVEAPPNHHSPADILDKKHGNVLDDSQMRPAANLLKVNALSGTTKRAKRSALPAFAENVDRSVSGEAQSKERFVEAVQGFSNPRAEYRRTGEEDRGSNPRQSEPYLDTSTFALSGDSAHNQAMVHWSGHNSSVSSSIAS